MKRTKRNSGCLNWINRRINVVKMGIQGSKINEGDEYGSEELFKEGSLSSTPISAPKSRLSELDPRSPTANIARTPIQVAHNLNETQTPVIGEINTSTYEEIAEKDRITSIDPRSPSVEFTRTPIVVEHLPFKLRNKNLDNVRQQTLQFSPVRTTKPIMDSKETKPQGPILLDSTPIKKKPHVQKRHSYIGLLETNLDYIETNLNNVPRKTNLEKLVDEKEALFATPNTKYDVLTDPRSPTVEFLRTPLLVPEDKVKDQIEEITTHVEDINISDNQNEQKYNDAETPNNDVFIDLENNEKLPKEQIDKVKSKILDEAIISPIKSTLEKMCQIDNEIRDVIAITQNPIVHDNRNTANEFDKKVTDLIYQDQTEYNTLPRTKKSKNNVRTPLGLYNVNSQQRLNSGSKLKVSDKPMNKHVLSTSKIPVYRDTKARKPTKIQCENTPPRTMNICPVQPKKAQWDTDKTLII